MKYYAVAKGRKPGIYLTWKDCKEQVYGFGGAKYKSFSSQEEALAFFSEHNEGRLPKQLKQFGNERLEKQMADQKNKHIDLCLLCGRPFKQQKTKNGRRSQGLCMSCKSKQQKIRSSLKHITMGKISWLSANDLVYIKTQYKCEDVFSFVLSHPEAAFSAKENTDSGLIQKALSKNRKTYYSFESKELTPLYIKSLLGESKEFVRITGDKRDPLITFHCKRCEKDFSVKYRNLMKHKGHDCTAIISSGEAIIKAYLDEKQIKYFTQRETLKCVNPDTGYVMPYDFELPEYKVIIEVQGEQHRSFIERFHIDIEGFHYQQERDAYKKRYAEENGYEVIEIWYSDLPQGKYKTIISNKLRCIERCRK